MSFLLAQQVGFDGTGKLLALDVNAYCGGGSVMDGVHDTCQEFNTSVDCCYHVPVFRTQATPCAMNRAPNTALRAPGHMQVCYFHRLRCVCILYREELRLPKFVDVVPVS